MSTIGTPVLWSGFIILIIFMLSIDLVLQKNKKDSKIEIKQASTWSVIWIISSLLFCFVLWCYLVLTKSRSVADSQSFVFLTGYLIEKFLAVDNAFVWLILFNYFSIPISLQRRILLYGVFGAILLRTVMIFSGIWLIKKFDWILYIFGIFLFFTGMKIFLTKTDFTITSEKPLIKWIFRHFRFTETIDNEKFFLYTNHSLFATPLLLVLILVELSDIIFAIDSIPAIFAITTDPFILLTSNTFAILGLRSMYFLLSCMSDRFSMIKYGLSIILMFIGAKMLFIKFYKISVFTVMIILFSVFVITIIVNIFFNHKNRKINK